MARFEEKALTGASLFVAALLYSSILVADTTFSYQGRLEMAGQAHTGEPAMRFLLFNAETGGSALGEINIGSVMVVDGLFQVDLDFGDVFDGSPRWLEVRVDGVPLVPRQAIRASPLATFALESRNSGAVRNMSAPGDTLVRLFSSGTSATPDDLDATHDTEGRVVTALRTGTTIRTVRCNNPDCRFGPASPGQTVAVAPQAAGSEAPLEILLGPDGLIHVLYGGTGNSLVLVRCVTTACAALETVLQLTLTQAVRDVSLAVQDAGFSASRLALMAVLTDGSSLIYRCATSGCASGATATLSSAAGAVRISATSIASTVNESLAVATTHSDGILRITMCGSASCNERSTVSGINGNDAVQAITGIDSRPLFGYFKPGGFTLARCTLSNCFSLAETTMGSAFSSAQKSRLSGTVLGNGLPAFVMNDVSFQVLICSNSRCSEPSFFINPGRPFFRLPIATVGPDGALRIIRNKTDGGLTNFIEHLQCRDAVNCVRFHRPK